VDEWVKIGLIVAGVGIGMWSMMQQHEYRLDQLEHDFAAHLEKHDVQNERTNKMLHDMELQLAKVLQRLSPNGQ